jgi:hypothetical protein
VICGYVQAAFADQHFDQDYNFCAVEEDLVTKKVLGLNDYLQVDLRYSGCNQASQSHLVLASWLEFDI